MRLFFFLFCLFICSNSNAAPPQAKVYKNNSVSINLNTPRTAVLVPLDTIISSYQDNTVLFPEIELSDSFYCEAANNLILFESSRLFKVNSSVTCSAADTCTRWTSFAEDTTGKGATALFIGKLAMESNVEYVIVAFAGSLQHTTIQQQGWRGGKYSGTYERPVAYSAKSSVHIQFWNKQGVLLYEKIASGSSGRPILYDSLKKRVKKSDIVSYSKKLFSPPLLRALNLAVRDAVNFKSL